MSGWDFIAWSGAAISLWGTAKYMVSIGKGDTHPRLASWIAWATANGVLMAVALMHDMHTAAVFNGIAALGNVSVLLLSAVKRAGQRPSGATDWTCLIASGACLATILLFPHLSLLDALLAMTANVIATWPTIQHAWRRPQEEAWQLFAANGSANALGLVGVFASAGANLGNIAGPLISMVGNVSLVLITVGRNWLSATVATVEEDIEAIAEEVETLRETLTDTPPMQTQEAASPRQRKPRLIRTY